jgi:hypothetical protein
VPGKPFEVDHLPAHRRDTGEDRGLARPGQPVEPDEGHRQRLIVKPCRHVPPPGPVPAVQNRHIPPDLGQNGGEGARPLPAAPAIDEGPPVARLVRQVILDMARGIPGDQRAADPARGKGTVLRVDRADAGAFGIAEHRHRHGTGHPVLGKLGRAAHVDDRVEACRGKPRQIGEDEGFGSQTFSPCILRKRWIRLEVSHRPPPICCTSA